MTKFDEISALLKRAGFKFVHGGEGTREYEGMPSFFYQKETCKLNSIRYSQVQLITATETKKLHVIYSGKISDDLKSQINQIRMDETLLPEFIANESYTIS